MLTSRLNVLGSKAVFAAVVMLLLPAAAAAKKRVVVLNFVGPQGKKAQAAVTGKIKGKYVIIPQAAFQKTAKSLKIKRPTDDDVANVARKLKADAIVAGIVQKSGRKFELLVTVRDGGSGTVIDKATIPLGKSPKVDKKANAKIASEVLPLLDRANGSNAFAASSSSSSSSSSGMGETKSGDTENPLDKGTSGSGSASTASAIEPNKPVEDPTANAMGGKVSKQADTSSETSTTASATPAGERPAWRPLAVANFDLSGVGRSLTFDGNNMNTLQGYSGGMVFAMGVAAELNPFASNAGSLKGLGFYFSIDKVLSISSTLKRAGQPDQSLDSSELLLTLGAQYGYRLRETADSVTVGGRFGYGLTSFEINVPTNLGTAVTVPDVGYKYLEIGPFIRVPFEVANSWWELGAHFSYLPVFDAGMITSGGRSGTISMGSNGSASGIELALGLSWRFKPTWDATLGFKLDRFGISYDQGASATGASDLFYTIGAGIGVVY
jgi:hypothetical protein